MKNNIHDLISRVQGCIRNMSFIISYILLFSATCVFAGGEEGHGEPSILQAYLWPVINFLILVALLIYMVKKMDLKGYFRKRTELIEQTLKEAREAKELAQKALAEVENRLKVKDKEIEDILAYAKQSGESEKARLVEEGNVMKARILDQAKVNIDYEVKKAKDAIKQEAVELAMELAEKKIKEQLTRDDQIRLLEESLTKIEGRN